MRKPIPKGEIRKLKRYFQKKQCVVTGTTEAHWHHIDFDEENSVFPNLVPLAGSYNSSLGDRPKSITFALLDPDALISQAQIKHLQWNTSAALGCCRIGFYIKRHQTLNIGTRTERSTVLDYDQLIKMSGRSLYYLRHKFDHELLSDVLRRDMGFLVNKASAISADTAISVLTEIATLFADFGFYADSGRLCEKMETIRRRNQMIFLDAESIVTVMKRNAMILDMSGSNRDIVEGLYREADAMTSRAPMHISIALSRAYGLLAREDMSLIIDLLEPIWMQTNKRLVGEFGDVNPININHWHVLDLFTIYSVALNSYSGKRMKNKAGQLNLFSERISQSFGSQLSTFIQDFNTRHFSPVSHRQPLDANLKVQLEETATEILRKCGAEFL